MAVFIGYPRCSTSNKAQAWLDAHGISYTFRHIREANPSKAELTEWLKASGLPLRRFFNTSGTLYKALHLKDRLPEMSQEAQIELLSTDGLLVKRPIFIGEGFVLVGFRQAEWEEKLL